jgi:hypothetical protein
MQALNSDDTYRKHQAIRRNAENGIRTKFQVRFFVELILAIGMMVLAMFGITNAVEESSINHTFWVPVTMLPAFGLMAAGVWKFADMRQAELIQRANDACADFRKAFGLEF